MLSFVLFRCGNINWARRSTCNVCNAPKIGPEEQRTGNLLLGRETRETHVKWARDSRAYGIIALDFTGLRRTDPAPVLTILGGREGAAPPNPKIGHF